MHTTALAILAAASFAQATPFQNFLQNNGHHGGNFGFNPGPFVRCHPSDLKQLSCHNTTAIKNSCCNEVRGGQVLQTQFWDTIESEQGPNDSWTIHGLWPDKCDGSYEAHCDPSRDVSGEEIAEILKNNGKTELLDYINKYWPDNVSVNGSLWAHEFNKHATCYSTFVPSCYAGDSYSEGTGPGNRKDVVDYFGQTVNMFRKLDTYKILCNEGIRPSLTKNYTMAEIQSAIVKAHGKPATIACNKQGQLSEVWYHFNVYGNVLGGSYVPADTMPPNMKSSCPETNIQYPPKTGSWPPKY